MLDGRLYRAAFLPFLIALAVAAFSLHPEPAPLGSNLPAEAFEAGPAISELHQLESSSSARRPGSMGDGELAGRIASTLRSLGGTAGGGFSVHVYSFRAQTIEGERTLRNVVAVRPGSTSEAPILIVAHRDSARGPAAGELSGTAALIELARVFASRETRRTDRARVHERRQRRLRGRARACLRATRAPRRGDRARRPCRLRARAADRGALLRCVRRGAVAAVEDALRRDRLRRFAEAAEPSALFSSCTWRSR